MRRFVYIFLLSIWAVPSAQAQSFDPARQPFGFIKQTNVNIPDKHAARENGRRFGATLVYAGLSLQQVYNDNIYLSSTQEEQDFISVLNPFMRLEQSAGRHEFAVDVIGDVKRYWDNQSENTEDILARLSGTVEAYHNLRFPFSLQFSRDHRARSNRVLSSISEEPVRFHDFKTRIGVLYNPGRITVESNVSYEQTRLFNGRLRATGARIVNEDGDEDKISWETRIAYDTQKMLKPFAGFNFIRSDFLRGQFTGTAFDGAERDYKSYEGIAGAAFDYHGIVSGNLSLGRLHRTYDDSSITDQDNNILSFDLQYVPREDWRFSLAADKAAREDNLIQAGTENISVGMSIAHDLRAELVLGGDAGYRNREFTESNRKDDLYGAGIDLRYQLGPGLGLSTGYAYRRADSTVNDFEYQQSQIFIRAEAAL